MRTIPCAPAASSYVFLYRHFLMSSLGRDDISHLSMSLHNELNRTYGASRTACFIWRHSSSIAFRSGHPRGKNSSSRPPSREISSLASLDLCYGAPSVIIRIFPNLSHAVFRNSTNSFPVKEPYLWKNPSPSSVIRSNTVVLECDPVYV